MKRDIQRIMLATAVPLFLIFILFLLKIVEVGMDWDFSHMGIYPLEKRGITGILTHPLIHSGFSHLLANTLPLFFFIMVLVLFLQGDSRTYFYDHLDRSRTADLHYRQTGMAHRCQRTDLRTCLLSFFQWYPAEICSSDCHLTACHLFCMEESSGICSPTSLPPTCHGKDISAEESWEHSVHSVS